MHACNASMDARLARESFGDDSAASSTIFYPLTNAVDSASWVFFVAHQETLQSRHTHFAIWYSSSESRGELCSLFIDCLIGGIEVLEQVVCLLYSRVLELNPDVGAACVLV